jgi:predicted ABC-type ATPase
MSDRPQVVILDGPNGAGKSTAAPQSLVGELGVTEFVNADVIARGTLADRWSFFDNSGDGGPQLIASGGRQAGTIITDSVQWRQIQT